MVVDEIEDLKQVFVSSNKEYLLGREIIGVYHPREHDVVLHARRKENIELEFCDGDRYYLLRHRDSENLPKDINMEMGYFEKWFVVDEWSIYLAPLRDRILTSLLLNEGWMLYEATDARLCEDDIDVYVCGNNVLYASFTVELYHPDPATGRSSWSLLTGSKCMTAFHLRPHLGPKDDLEGVVLLDEDPDE